MVGTEGLLPSDSLALSTSGGIGNSTNDLMSGSLLTDATFGESNDLTALSRTLKTSSSGGGEPSAELAELNASAAPISQAGGSLDLGQNLQSFASSPTSSTTKPVEAADADPFSGQALNALAANDSVENLQTTNTPTIKYLSDLDWISATSGWGPVEKDISNGEKQAGDGQKITLNGKSYNKGLGTHSASEIRYALDGNYTNFRSDIGIDDEVGAKGSAKFQVWADGTKLFDGGVMSGDSATKQVDVDLAGKQELKLIVTDGGNNTNFDHADWANARLIGGTSGGEENPKPTPSPEPDPTPPPSSGSGKKARSADSFIDSIGITTHLRYGGANQKYDSIIKPRLEELGIRHIRDGGKGSDFFQKLNDLAKSGIKSTLVADPRDGVTPFNIVDVLKKIPNSVEAVEGPNEWDVHPELKYNGKSFPEGLRDYQNSLFKAINSDSATKDILVAAPSMARPQNGSKLGRLGSIDLGNMHSYQGGQRPTNGLESTWIPNTKKVSGDKPIIVTETGWHNANDSSGQPSVPQDVEAKYTPRLYLEYFNNPAIERTFRYELIDQGTNKNRRKENWGLLNNDGSPQPAFNALKNLIDLTEDPGAKGFTPGKLDYKLSGDLENVHQTLLQKRNGEFDLILWQDAKGYDTKSKKKISIPSNKVTLDLNTPIKSAKTYLPLNSTTAFKSYSNPTRIDLSVPDHPLVIQLTYV